MTEPRQYDWSNVGMLEAVARIAVGIVGLLFVIGAIIYEPAIGVAALGYGLIRWSGLDD
jgi:hypothetical protein